MSHGRFHSNAQKPAYLLGEVVSERLFENLVQQAVRTLQIYDQPLYDIVRGLTCKIHRKGPALHCFI